MDAGAVGVVRPFDGVFGIRRLGGIQRRQSVAGSGKQAQFVAGGLVFAVLAFCVKMSVWRKASLWLLLSNIFMLLLVLIVGREINGAKRWIDLGLFSYQPSETYKLAIILYLAAFFNRRAKY